MFPKYMAALMQLLKNLSLGKTCSQTPGAREVWAIEMADSQLKNLSLVILHKHPQPVGNQQEVR